MTKIDDLHQQAMALVDEALIKRHRGDESEAANLLRLAFTHEKKAAEIARSESCSEPTRSILHRSAATLALDCGEIKEAERLVATALSLDPPSDIAEELRDVFQNTQFHRHLDLHGISLQADELQLSIAGKVVAHGLVESEAFLSRVQFLEKLVYRTAERIRGRPFHEAGPFPKAILKDFTFYLSVPRAASFAVTMRLGSSKQMILEGMSDAEHVIDEVIESLHLFEDQRRDELQKRIPDKGYYRNFVALSGQLAPDGERISQVGLTVVRRGQRRSVGLKRPVHETLYIDSLRELEEKAEPVTVTGFLRFADSTKDEQKIKLVAEGKHYTVIVPEGMMADIVRPLWEFEVIVKGQRVGKKIHLQNIERSAES